MTLYWILSLTWGLPMTLLGGLAALVLRLCGLRPYRNIYGFVFEVGPLNGGFSLGPITVAPTSPSRHLLNHEFGHSIQNCFLGPFMPLLVSIPSIIRFWYREISKKTSPPYDSIWFEGTATSLGNRFYKAQSN